MKCPKSRLLSAVALGALMSLNLSTAKADDIEREIRLLKVQIKRLEEKVAKQEQQVRGIAKSRRCRLWPRRQLCARTRLVPRRLRRFS